MQASRTVVACVVGFKWVAGVAVSRVLVRRDFARDELAGRWIDRQRKVFRAGWTLVTGCRLYGNVGATDRELVRQVRAKFFRPDLSGLN